jgi:hypothetical protein
MTYDMISHVKTHIPNRGYEFPLQLPPLIPSTNQTKNWDYKSNSQVNSLRQLPPLIPMPLPIQLPNTPLGYLSSTFRASLHEEYASGRGLFPSPQIVGSCMLVSSAGWPTVCETLLFGFTLFFGCTGPKVWILVDMVSVRQKCKAPQLFYCTEFYLHSLYILYM